MAESITFRAADGFALGAALVVPPKPAVAAVLIAPAMGVPRRLYGSFADYLAEAGLASLTVDYRGMGESRSGPLRTLPAQLHDWGELDLAAGLAELTRRFPNLPLLWFGHSVGGQLFGLVPAPRVKGALLLASQSGYWANWPGLDRLMMFAVWHAIIPGAVLISGRLPMKAFGQGEDLPPRVAAEWARWGRHPDYVWSYARDHGGLGFRSYAGPMRFYGFTDDRYAPPRSVEALQRFYTSPQSELRIVRPSDVGARSIGHFGFFKPSFQSTLWSEAREWLLARAGAAPAAQASA